MTLHLNKIIFKTIIDNLYTKHGIRRDILEKDYYVTLMLYELSNKPNQSYTYFKGGTALYKALKSIRRFSEDIDLTVYIGDLSTNSQKQKRLKDAVFKYSSLELEKEISNKKGSIEVQYKYDSIYDINTNDSLDRFKNVRIEATNFGLSEPIETHEIEWIGYTLCNDEEKEILKSFSCNPFNIKTLTLERIFFDKLFATEHYININNYRDLAKHTYDLIVLSELDSIKEFLNDTSRIRNMLDLQYIEERSRFGGIDYYPKCFKYLNYGFDYNKLVEAFNYIQNVYVFNTSDLFEIGEIKEMIDSLFNVFSNIL